MFCLHGHMSLTGIVTVRRALRPLVTSLNAIQTQMLLTSVCGIHFQRVLEGLNLELQCTCGPSLADIAHSPDTNTFNSYYGVLFHNLID